MYKSYSLHLIGCLLKHWAARLTGLFFIIKQRIIVLFNIIPKNINSIYIDNAVVCQPGVFAAYTPYGIKRIDSDFCKRIQNLDKNPEELKKEILDSTTLREGEKEDRLCHLGESPETLRKDIIENKHLHPFIKKNLLQNLKRVVKDMGLSEKEVNNV